MLFFVGLVGLRSSCALHSAAYVLFCKKRPQGAIKKWHCDRAGKKGGIKGPALCLLLCLRRKGRFGGAAFFPRHKPTVSKKAVFFFTVRTIMDDPDHLARIENACLDEADNIIAEELSMVIQFGGCAENTQEEIENCIHQLKTDRNIGNLSYIDTDSMPRVQAAGMKVLMQIICELKEQLAGERHCKTKDMD